MNKKLFLVLLCSDRRTRLFTKHKLTHSRTGVVFTSDKKMAGIKVALLLFAVGCSFFAAHAQVVIKTQMQWKVRCCSIVRDEAVKSPRGSAGLPADNATVYGCTGCMLLWEDKGNNLTLAISLFI